MKNALKAVAVILNILGIVAGVWTSVVMLFKLKFYPVLFIQGMTTAESLYFNMVMFVLGLAAIMFIVPSLAEIKVEEVEFPTVWAIAPLVIGVIGIISAFTLTGVREIILVILFSIIYFVLSGTLIYNCAKIFQYRK